MTFQEARRKGLGASDSAAILRLSEWADPYTVAVEKILGEFQPESEPLKWGKLVEPLLLKEFVDRTGYECVPGREREFWPHESIPYIFANCDGVQNCAQPEYVIEAKTSRFGDGFGPDGSDEIPDVYNVQVHHQMWVTGARTAYLIVLIGGNNCRLYRIEYNAEIIEALEPILVEFWNDYVLARRLPDPDFSHPATARVLRAVIKLNPEMELRFDSTDEPLYEIAQRYELMRRVEKLAKGEKDSLKSQMRVQSQGAGLIMFPDGTKITQKTQKRRGYVVQPTEYETMNLTWKGTPQDGSSLTGIRPLQLGDSRPGEEAENFE